MAQAPDFVCVFVVLQELPERAELRHVRLLESDSEEVNEAEVGAPEVDCLLQVRAQTLPLIAK